jgi:UDP-GlcNAc:undecaprenyl-phosphate GlcNAc-1-phosphate transferase
MPKSPSALGLLISLLIIYSTGIVDDLIGLDAKVKFATQIIAACILPFCGLYINNLYGLFGIHAIPYYIGFPLTILTIVFIDNAMNLIDGIDGLSASLSIIALAGFAYCFIHNGLIVYAILIAGLIGILVTYLYFNIWGDPNKNRKIFMGDSGSLTLGFILGFLFVKALRNDPRVMLTIALYRYHT